MPSLPEVPSLLDLGYGMSVTSPYGLEPEVVEVLHRPLKTAFADAASQAII